MSLLPDIDPDDLDNTNNSPAGTGKVDTNKEAGWQAFDSSHSQLGDEDGSLETGEEVPPYGYAKIWLQYNYSAGQTYTIKVTTTVGTFAETVVTAPA